MSVIRPQDVLPDGVDGAVLNGVAVRKGSVAAFVANAQRLAQLNQGEPEYAQVLAEVRALVPAVAAVGVFQVFQVRSPVLAGIIEEMTEVGSADDEHHRS
ncbi:MAG TPA: hypothetical protein VGH89_11320 [Pseudonocardia sp.]|jgi:antirestriction protein ArdC